MAVAVLMPMDVLMVVNVLMVVGMLVVMPVDMVVGVAGMSLVLGRLVDMAVEGHVVAFLLFPAHGDGHLGAGDAALHSGLGGEHHPRQAQAVHALHKALGSGWSSNKAAVSISPAAPMLHSKYSVFIAMLLFAIDCARGLYAPLDYFR